MRTIALIETDWSGHHSIYFKFFTQTLLEIGYRVIALCPEPHELKDWLKANFSKNVELLHAFQFKGTEINSSLIDQSSLIYKLNLFFMAKKRWSRTAAALNAASLKTGFSPDLVFFAFLDSYLGSYLTDYIVDNIFPYKWSGLYVQPHSLRGQRKFEFIHHGHFNPHSVLHSSHCQSVAILDEGVAEKLQKLINQKPVIIFPDFADTSKPDRQFEVTKQIREKAQGRKIIGLLGSLEKRKGVLKLLEVAQALQQEFFFVFAGKLYQPSFSHREFAEIRTFINSNPDNCFFHLDWIPDESKFNSLVEICDVLWAVYDYPHSSNILTKAALFEKPLVVSNRFCMGERVQRFQLGTSVNQDSALECISALKKLCSQLGLDDGLIQPNYETYRYLHSIEQLEVKFKDLLGLVFKT